MKKESRHIINQFTKTIREILEIKTDNFDIIKVVEDLGGKIIIDASTIDEATIRKSDDDSFEIVLNAYVENEKRRRFSIAHELGHLFLHMRYQINNKWNEIPIGSKFNRNTGIPYSRLEKEANEFAAAFLMPDERFLVIAEDTSDKDSYYIDKIANVFNVSEQTVEIRGKNLGLWR